jgi:predicted short-subunit dehydrogenase-like oxidoreductase (DUF2520 family)
MSSIKKMVLIGTGNVAWHLGTALSKAGIDVVQVFGRRPERAKALAAQLQSTPISDFNNLAEDADFYLVCVSDAAIAEVGRKLQNVRGIVAHTSGSVRMDALSKNENRGVFYPLQTFTAGVPVDFNHVPLLCEGNSAQTEAALMALAFELSTKVFAISSDQREKLHVAAVFANNFTNHLFAQAHRICEANKIPFSVLHPLILETARKATETNPEESQTGPAKRGDAVTIEKHLNQLTDPNLHELYLLLTKSIQKNV